MVEENSQEPLPPAEGVLWRRAWSRAYHFERAQTSLRARIIFSIMEENRREEPAPAAEEENKREEPEEQLPASEIHVISRGSEENRREEPEEQLRPSSSYVIFRGSGRSFFDSDSPLDFDFVSPTEGLTRGLTYTRAFAHPGWRRWSNQPAYDYSYLLRG